MSLLADVTAHAAAQCGAGELALILVTRTEGPSYCVGSAELITSVAAGTSAGDGPGASDGDDLLAVMTVGPAGTLTDYPIRNPEGTIPA